MSKTVKAVLCATVIAVMLLSLAACSGNIAGRYELVSLDIEGVKQDVPSGLGYLELNADGTGRLNVAGTEYEMCWEDGRIWPVSDPEDSVSFTVNGNTLTMDLMGNTAFFKK